MLPALVRKFHEAKVSQAPEVVIWGTGTPRREFLYVDDLAHACVFLMENYSGESHINVGVGEDIEIRELAALVREITGYQGRIANELSKPDGTPRKLLDVSMLTGMGWQPRTSLREGITAVYAWYLSQQR